MMKLAGATIFLALASGIQGTGAAEESTSSPAPALSVVNYRLGVLGGIYDFDPSEVLRASRGDSYGLQAGVRYTTRSLIDGVTLFADASLERVSNRGEPLAGISANFNRTDLVLLVGAPVAKRLTPFLGYRLAWQNGQGTLTNANGPAGSSSIFDSGLFDDDLYREAGPLGGLSVQVWENASIATSLTVAYNETEVEYGKLSSFLSDDDQSITSFTLALTPVGSKNQFLLRWQRFELDRSSTNREEFAQVDYEEDYIHLIVQRRWTL